MLVQINNPREGELDWLQIFSNKIHNKYNWENGNLMNIYIYEIESIIIWESKRVRDREIKHNDL